jgi:C1A family cysteine protease
VLVSDEAEEIPKRWNGVISMAKLKRNKALLVVVPVVISLMLLVSFGTQPLQAQGPEGGEELELAAVNPDFVAFRQAPPAEFYGYIPPPVDLSHLKNIPVHKATLQAQAALPATFDWRTTGKVTPVKNQSTCGTCWIFGTLAAVESKVLIGESTAFDFSEQNVACCTDPSWTYLSADHCNGGGWSSLAADTLTKKGTRLESCDPYNTATIDTETCADTCTSIKLVTGYREVALTTADIKNAVSTQGPVSIAFYYNSGHYSSNTNTYYYPNCHTAANHLVCIVGWDDTIPYPRGGGSGAWIVKNSWGTDWGGTCGYGSERGYFYLCYGSGNMQEAAFYQYKNYDPLEKVYYWDEAGWVGSLGYTGGDTTSAWMANVFTVGESGTLTNVDFWATSNNASYAISIYQDGNPANGLDNLLTSQSGTGQEAGYYSIALTSPVSVSAGQPYTIAVKMTTPSYNYPLPVEYKVTGMCSPTIQTGVSYDRHTDTGTWTDMAPSYNACLRARVQKSGVVSVAVTSGTVTYGTVALGTTKNTITLGQTQTAKNDGTVAENFKIMSSDATRSGGTTWMLASAQGNNQFTHAFSTNGGSSWTAMTTSYQTLKTGVAPNGTQTFDLQIGMPTATDDYQEHTVIVTILAVAP